MSYNLVIAEKPSVAQAIAKVLGCTVRKDGYLEGNGYLVSWCIGHLVELAEPEDYDAKYEKWRKEDLPIIPETWEYRVNAGTRKQFEILKGLMGRKDVGEVTNACDAGREGELIFRLVYEKAGCQKKIRRLWISSMEDEAVRKGFENLAEEREYDRLYEAALCRERADWIVGINATRFFSTLYGQTLNVGRVMTPTLSLAVQREAQIRAFRPEDTFTVMLETSCGMLSSRKFKDERTAREVLEKSTAAGVITVTKAEKKEKREKAPALFDLTSLQREANRRLGFTAQQTLDYAQSLYEKKLVTYPRTDSRYLTDDMEESLPGLVKKAGQVSGLKTTNTQNLRAVINGSRVTDHHAIIPTASVIKADVGELPSGEKEILMMIAARLLEAVASPCVYAEAVLEGECGGESFHAKGRVQTDPGWRGITKAADEEDPDDEEGDLKLPEDLTEGGRMEITKGTIRTGKTTPPKSFTEDTLLSAMEKAGSDEIPDEAERKGLGTPATRAGILEKLVRTGFIERRGDKKTKYLVPTPKGETLIAVIPEVIKSASLTAQWERKLLEMEHGDGGTDAFMGEIRELVTNLINTYEVTEGAVAITHQEGEPVGKCPKCGNDVIEKSRGFFCSNGECRFSLWKENRYFEALSKKLTKQVAVQLLKTKRAKLKNCRSVKSGKTFDADIVLTVREDGQACFALDFGKGGRT